MILADTNVVSEFMRPEIDPGVARWAAGLAPDELALSVVTVQEIEYGILRLADGRRKDRLGELWGGLLHRFRSAIVDYDREAASAAAGLLARAQARGRPMSLADAQIAGTCLARGLTLATRNVRDFSHEPELQVVDPFRPPT